MAGFQVLSSRGHATTGSKELAATRMTDSYLIRHWPLFYCLSFGEIGHAWSTLIMEG